MTRAVAVAMGLALVLTACAPMLAQRCEHTLGGIWVEKRGEAGTVIGHECRRKESP